MNAATHFYETSAEPITLRRLSDRIGPLGRQISNDLDGLSRGHLTLAPKVQRAIAEAEAALAQAKAFVAGLPGGVA